MSTMDTPGPASLPPCGRIDLVDLARGLALAAMFVFHFAYDLSLFGLIETNVPAEPGWRLFARLIAGSFLAIVGLSLVLATRRGLNRAAFLKRLAMVAAAACAVTLATFLAMPESFVFFGILHHIALASLLALPFLRLPALALTAAAAAAFALPAFVAHPWLDGPWAVWLGFSRMNFQSADFVPVFPWFGCVLAGMAVGRWLLPQLDSRAASWRASSPPARLLAWGGRHSLAVYLLHQPLFLGALMLAMQTGLARPVPPAERAAEGFLRPCRTSCEAAGTAARECVRLCDCAAEGLRRENLWRPMLDGLLTQAEGDRAAEIGRICARGP